jgi:hypothetical protein
MVLSRHSKRAPKSWTTYGRVKGMHQGAVTKNFLKTNYTLLGSRKGLQREKKENCYPKAVSEFVHRE